MCVCSQTPDDVTKMGVAAYNAECRKIVMRSHLRFLCFHLTEQLILLYPFLLVSLIITALPIL